MSEREVYRIAQDLRAGNAQDAANVIRYELQTQPQQALQDLRAANNIAGPNARLHVGQRPDGDVALVDNYGRSVANLGRLQQYNGYDNRYPNNNGYDNRYPNSNGYDNRYPNGANGYPQDMSYLNNNRYNGGQNYGIVGRLANDLARGDTRDAAMTAENIMRSYNDPNRALNEANRLADQRAYQMGYRSAMEHIAQTRNGDLAVVDQYGRQLARIENYNNNNRYYPNNNDRYYPNNNDRYYPNNGSYYPNNGSYYPNNGSYYPNNNGYYNGGQRYYGNINGGEAAAAIGLSILGGMVLSNIGRHNHNNHNNYNNYNNYHHHRR